MSIIRYGGRSIARWLAVAAMAALTACSSFELAVDTAKRVQPEPEPEPKGIYKVGKPYRVEGQWYYPKADYSYNEQGIASWYGPNFHGKLTANGEVFDMRKVSAAHKTLPLPSVVRVTNLENGRSLLIRINDRGPFVTGRIIDLSQRAAELLNFADKGTAMVEVQVMVEESRRAALALGAGDLPEFGPVPPKASPSIEVTVERLNPEDGVAVASATTPTPPPFDGMTSIQAGAMAPRAASESEEPNAPQGDAIVASVVPESRPEPQVGETVTVVPLSGAPVIFIQAGAFARYDNANRLRARLVNLGHPVKVTQIYVTNQPMFRVRVGPLASVEAADQTLDRVIVAGYPDARIIVD